MTHSPADRTLSITSLLRLCSRNHRQLHFVSPAPIYLEGLENWLGAFERISLTDCRDGAGRETILLSGLTSQDFPSSEDCSTYIAAHSGLEKPDNGLAVTISSAPGSSITEADALSILREARVKHELRAIMAPPSYAEFRKLCRNEGLSFTIEACRANNPAGQAPFLVASEEDWRASGLEGQNLICFDPAAQHGYSVEAVATRSAVISSPLQRILRDQYWGVRRWAVASCVSGDDDVREKAAAQIVRKIGAVLASRGREGTFAVEFCDYAKSGGELVVSRILPFFSVHSVLAHFVTSFHGGFPLHLLHFLPFLDPVALIDPADFRGKFTDFDSWSVLAVRHIGDTTEMITRAPASGLYQMADDGVPVLTDPAASHRDIVGDEHGLFLRLQGSGNYRAAGGLLGLILLRTETIDSKGKLMRHAQRWVDAFTQGFSGLPVSGSSLPKSVTIQPSPDII